MSETRRTAEDLAHRLDERDPETCPTPREAAEVVFALLAELEQAERERDKWSEQALAVGADYAVQDLEGLDDHARIQQLEARLAKVPALVEAAANAKSWIENYPLNAVDSEWGTLANDLDVALATWDSD